MATRIGQSDGLSYLSELQRILEPEIAARAADRIVEQQLAAVREAFESMNSALADSDSYIEADLDFHLALAEAAGNPMILSLLDLVIGQMREQRGRIFKVSGGPERGQYDHARILEAVAKKSPEAVRAAMLDHLQLVSNDSEPEGESNLGSSSR